MANQVRIQSFPDQLIEDKVLQNYQTMNEAVAAIKKALGCQKSYAYEILHKLEEAKIIEIHPARISIVRSSK